MLRPYTVLYYNTSAFEASARGPRSAVRGALGEAILQLVDLLGWCVAVRDPRTSDLVSEAEMIGSWCLVLGPEHRGVRLQGVGTRFSDLGPWVF